MTVHLIFVLNFFIYSLCSLLKLCKSESTSCGNSSDNSQNLKYSETNKFLVRDERSQYINTSAILDFSRPPLCADHVAMGEPAEHRALFADPVSQPIPSDLSKPVSLMTLMSILKINFIHYLALKYFILVF